MSEQSIVSPPFSYSHEKPEGARPQEVVHQSDILGFETVVVDIVPLSSADCECRHPLPRFALSPGRGAHFSDGRSV